jgi:CRISPR/Cas system CSM-associated protein Csm3 (group 7 of RAMP superfamily)
MARRQADELELALLEPDLKGRARAAAQRKLEAAQTSANILDKELEAQQQAEGEVWCELWATPQAVAWERLGWTREVAQYVRWKVRAEFGDLDASKEARQLGDRLGLTPLAMLRLRWEVAPDEVAEQRQERTSRAKARTPRQRLRVVDPEGGSGAVAGG